MARFGLILNQTRSRMVLDASGIPPRLQDPSENKIENQIFNVGYENLSIMDIAKIVKKVVETIVDCVGFKGNVRWIKDDRFTKQDIKIYNNTKLKKLYPNVEFTPIEDGIKKTINWWTKKLDI